MANSKTTKTTKLSTPVTMEYGKLTKANIEEFNNLKNGDHEPKKVRTWSRWLTVALMVENKIIKATEITNPDGNKLSHKQVRIMLENGKAKAQKDTAKQFGVIFPNGDFSQFEPKPEKEVEKEVESKIDQALSDEVKALRKELEELKK